MSSSNFFDTEKFLICFLWLKENTWGCHWLMLMELTFHEAGIVRSGGPACVSPGEGLLATSQHGRWHHGKSSCDWEREVPWRQRVQDCRIDWDSHFYKYWLSQEQPTPVRPKQLYKASLMRVVTTTATPTILEVSTPPHWSTGTKLHAQEPWCSNSTISKSWCKRMVSEHRGAVCSEEYLQRFCSTVVAINCIFQNS